VADTYRVTWDPGACGDLVEIVRFIANDSLLDARRAAARLNTGAASLSRHPQRYRRVPELAQLPDFTGLASALEVRELIVRPWRLTFAIEGRGVRVVAIVDSRRDMVAWLERHVQRLGKHANR
jgi:plasmid stabilization system protein ParE